MAIVYLLASVPDYWESSPSRSSNLNPLDSLELTGVYNTVDQYYIFLKNRYSIATGWVSFNCICSCKTLQSNIKDPKKREELSEYNYECYIIESPRSKRIDLLFDYIMIECCIA